MNCMYEVPALPRPCRICRTMSKGKTGAAVGAAVAAAVPAAKPPACPTAACWLASPDGIGDLGGFGVRRQPGGGRRRIRVAEHRRGVLGPHFPVLRLESGDRTGVLPENVRCQEQRQLGAVQRDLGRRYHCGESCLVGARGRLCLVGRHFGLRPGGRHPRHIRCSRPPPSRPTTDRSTSRWPSRR